VLWYCSVRVFSLLGDFSVSVSVSRVAASLVLSRSHSALCVVSRSLVGSDHRSQSLVQACGRLLCTSGEGARHSRTRHYTQRWCFASAAQHRHWPAGHHRADCSGDGFGQSSASVRSLLVFVHAALACKQSSIMRNRKRPTLCKCSHCCIATI
jgi:hypothetical protein